MKNSSPFLPEQNNGGSDVFPTTQGCYPQYLQVASGRQPLLQGSPVIHRSGDSYERESRAVARLALLAVVP